jgi:PIN domain nuclease of toxin-antitoxin system
MGVEEIDLEEDARSYSPTYYLLDTCALLWATNEPEKLSNAARAVWRDPNRMIAVSVVNYCESAIAAKKHGIDHVSNWWQRRVLPYVDLETLPLREEHITELLLLPPLHKDPFDRMLIAQARVENMLLVTSDKQIQAYDVRTVW